MFNKINILTQVVGLILVFFAPLSALADLGWTSETRPMWDGIPITLRFSPENPRLANEIWAYLDTIDAVFNDYNPQSEISQINANTLDGPIKISAQMVNVLQQSMRACRYTNGAFDMTTGTLRRLWKNARQKKIPPSYADIEEAKKHVGFAKLSISEHLLTRTDRSVQLDLGGIIKGIAVDEVVKLLKSHAVHAALVQIGGETAAFGSSPRGDNFRVAVEHPLAPGSVYTIIEDQGRGFSGSTSGNYRRPIEINGKSYYHIFDPRTGSPARTDVLSVSVIFPEVGQNGLADALCTAGVVMGPEDGRKVIEQLGGDALFLMDSGTSIKEFSTPGWARWKAKVNARPAPPQNMETR